AAFAPATRSGSFGAGGPGFVLSRGSGSFCPGGSGLGCESGAAVPKTSATATRGLRGGGFERNAGFVSRGWVGFVSSGGLRAPDTPILGVLPGSGSFCAGEDSGSRSRLGGVPGSIRAGVIRRRRGRR